MLALCILAARSSAQSSTAVTRDTTIRSYDGRLMPATLVRLEVPERRTTPGRTITIAALRLPTTADHPGNPIAFLMGGPGIPGSVMVPIPPYFTLFDRLRALGDVIIVDQRGIGRSEPVLDCPFSGSLSTEIFSDRAQFVDALQRQVAACSEHWRSAGADPTAYNTLESADDLDALRAAVGADRIDLLAFSYGTRWALAYLQRHEAHVGRIVLQGVNGPGLVLKRPVGVARKLSLLGEQLAHDSAWHEPHDLLAAMRKARARLASTPAVVEVTDRRLTRPAHLRITRDGFDAIVGLSLDDRRLPALLVSVAGGDDRVLANLAGDIWNGLAGGTVGLMARAVNCAADRPAERRRLIARESEQSPIGVPIDNAFLTDDFCRAVGHDVMPVEFHAPVRSAVPTLLLTGSLDATNPVENAHDVARGLSNALLLDIGNAAHEALPVPSVQDVVVDFLRGTDVAGRRVVAGPPRFASVEEAARPAPRRGP